MTSSVAGPRRSSKALPRAKLAPKKGHGHCLVACCQRDPLQFPESRWNHYIWEVCSSNRRDAQKLPHLQLALVNRMGPILLHGNAWLYKQCVKSWANWTMKFCPIHHVHLTSCQPTTTSSSTLTNFCRENASTTSRRKKMLSKSSLNPKDGFLCYRNKQTFPIGKNMLVVMVPILIHKDVFQLSYNDLKFTVWYCNYVCTNHIAHAIQVYQIIHICVNYI